MTQRHIPVLSFRKHEEERERERGQENNSDADEVKGGMEKK